MCVRMRTEPALSHTPFLQVSLGFNYTFHVNEKKKKTVNVFA